MYNVQADDAAAGFGVCVHTDPGYEAGMELRIEPGKRRLGWQPLAGPRGEYESLRLSGVREIEGRFSLEVIVKGDVLDVCVAERRTLIARTAAGAEGAGIYLFAHLARVRFENLRLLPL